ncbi:coat protein [Caucasus prunus virus]|uniref:Coat protein n=1 Tax=Caucasus prunus virus TaxID=1667230 RepID=A0A0H3Y7E3_9VIRU|nr:coat protein [Caucasus prunus virus]AKN08996.1 coat protein [Caucasus prunus virus]
MSAKLERKRYIFREVSEWAWRNFIDPEDRMQAWETGAGGEARNLTPHLQEQKARVLADRLRTLFGNIADHSAGPSTVFPNMDVSFMRLTVQGVDGVPEMVGSFNLRTFVENLKTHAATHQDRRMMGVTLREVCRSFANCALEYYMADEDRYSNLAEKMPQLAALSREVMFDFSDGISPQYLRGFPSRARVIQDLGSRLLQSTGTKAVFEARGTIEGHTNLIV